MIFHLHIHKESIIPLRVDCLFFFEPTLHTLLIPQKDPNKFQQKSSITFSPNTLRVFRLRLKSFFHVPVRNDFASYPGLLLGVTSNRKGCFKCILDKTQDATGWNSSISQA